MLAPVDDSAYPGRPRFLFPAHLFTLLCCLLFLVPNTPLWSEVFRVVEQDGLAGYRFAGVMFLILLLAMNGVLTLLAWPYLLKGVSVLLFLIAAGTFYFTFTFGVMVDREMIRNVFETNYNEVMDLVTLKMIFTLLLGGVVPSWLLFRLPIGFDPWRKALGKKGIVLALSLPVIGGLLGFNYKHFAIVFRNNNHLRHMIVPVNTLYGTYSYLTKIRFAQQKTVRPLGEDARFGPLLSAAREKPLLVLVVGETARAANFSLQGYDRKTNPELEKADGIYFTDVTSCGTSTAVSIPCMFSGIPRTDYTDKGARSQEGLLDVLRHAGTNVLWRDNNSGCKGTCDRVPTEDKSREKIPGVCDLFEGCLDGVLLDQLPEKMAATHDTRVIVLHLLGSHGPAYFKRYSPEFRRFTPTCDRLQIEDCDQQSIINTYDNSLLYTDYLLGEVLGMLKRQSYPTAMLYISDHGESLGENGLYLHGLPYAISPRVQTHVPLYVWLSSTYREMLHLDGGCMVQRKDLPFSHDNWFHTVLGLLDIQSAVYKEPLDIFAPCRLK